MAMHFQKLGRTGQDVGVISIGTEHLFGLPRETVASVIGAALDRGVNYFDVVFSFPDYLDHLGAAFRGRRDKVLLTGHLGSTVRNGQYCRTESAKVSRGFFLELLSRLGTETIDILFLHNFNNLRQWETAAGPGGRLELACRLRDEGKARFIGISGHDPEVMKQAIDTGQVDVVMFPLNLMGHAMPGRNELQELCARRNIGLVAMKPYGGGKLLTYRGTVRVPKYQTGGEAYKVRFPSDITPVQCISYVLTQVGVSTALVGVKTPEEVASALHTLDAAPAERDFATLVSAFGRHITGECVYCNHCLPCPEAIDIAATMRLLDTAQLAVPADLRSAYAALPVNASACTSCGACEQRCPFGVTVIAKLRQATELLEQRALIPALG